MPTFDLPAGYFGPSPNTMNEVDLVSTITEPQSDPPFLNIGSKRDAVGGVGLGGWRFGIPRADGQMHGVVLINGKIDERYRTLPGELVPGEVTCHISKPGVDNDARWVHVFTWRHDGVQFHVPILNRHGEPW